MCKNKIVLDMNTFEVFDHKLLPGMLTYHITNDSLLDWFYKRYSERSNTAARRIKGALFGQGKRQLYDKASHALSLSDCYWVRDRESNITFEQISPYYNDFWKGEGVYSNESIPTLYVNGFLTKYWADSATLVKHIDEREIVCSDVGRAIGINIVSAKAHSFNEHGEVNAVAISNFTNADVMFESAETSGKINPHNFEADDILRVYGQDGFDMIFMDALTGNGDRHAGNFGFLRNANTGEYLGKSPIFDFDHAYDSPLTNDFLIEEAIECGVKHYSARMHELIKACRKVDLNPLMSKRFESISRQFLEHDSKVMSDNISPSDQKHYNKTLKALEAAKQSQAPSNTKTRNTPSQNAPKL